MHPYFLIFLGKKFSAFELNKKLSMIFMLCTTMFLGKLVQFNKKLKFRYPYSSTCLPLEIAIKSDYTCPYNGIPVSIIASEKNITALNNKPQNWNDI